MTLLLIVLIFPFQNNISKLCVIYNQFRFSSRCKYRKNIFLNIPAAESRQSGR